MTEPELTPVRSRVESIVLVADSPVSADTLAEVLGVEAGEVEEALRSWQAELDSRGSGIELRGGEDGWRLYTRRANAPDVEAFLLHGAHARLSRAALETLAVVAYRQPVTRQQVAAVRGVNVDGVMRTLTIRGLVREVGPDEGSQAHRYETTELFLEQLGIASLDELPELAPLLPDVDNIVDTDDGIVDA